MYAAEACLVLKPPKRMQFLCFYSKDCASVVTNTVKFRKVPGLPSVRRPGNVLHDCLDVPRLAMEKCRTLVLNESIER